MNLCGVHDAESVVMTPADTWVLDTIALSENPLPKNYSPIHHWICRCNFGYGSTGTIPEQLVDTEFMYRLSNYVRGSKNCRRWVIGNEPNLRREWPNNQSINPTRYADFYMRARDVIKSLAGHKDDEVLIAASSPWNNEYKYAGNPDGDWIKYFTDVIGICNGNLDGFSIHAYTHDYDSALVTSFSTMNPPFQNRRFEFRTYRDYCNAIPEDLAHLPIYLTEANGNGPWKAVGLMPEMAREIDDWNKQSNKRKIKCLIFYRYPKYDEYNIEGKPDVIAEYKATVARGYQSPLISQTTSEGNMLFTGSVEATLLNVRNAPGTSGTQIVGSRSMGDKVSVFEEKVVASVTWYRIGKDQWVAASFIKKEGESSPRTDNWGRSMSFVLKWEGGWADDPNDPGGATMKGVTIGTYTKWRKEKGRSVPTKDDLRNISDKDVGEIYFEWYWLPSGSDKMEWPMCLCHFDLAVNGGVGRAAEALSKNGLNFWSYMVWRRDWYRRLDGFKHFGKAWINRCKDLILTAYE